MPERVQFEERYWCPGKWPWQWFRTCTRTVWKLCYDFSWVKEYRYFSFIYAKGCEAGVLYSWYTGCFGLVGTETFYRIRRCFGSQLSSKGSCELPPA